ncbi:MAG: glycosyltransferase family 9 protein, partial [Salinisphaeraceae bacterium]|nr:glycosyltransferase family 9 protein [Salinisphaeraceae bacterium]
MPDTITNQSARSIPSNPERLLLIRLSAVGDVINTLPALEALRQTYPQAHISYLVEDRAYTVIEGHPSIDEVILYPRKRWVKMFKTPGQWLQLWHEFRALLKQLREPQHDAVLNYQSNLKGALFAYLSKAKIRFGFAKENSKESSHLFNHVQVSPQGGEQINRVEKYIALSAALGADADKAAYRLPDRPDRRQAVQDWLQHENIHHYAVIHPGTSDFGAQKRWLPERFAELAQRIHQELGLACVITWGPGEEELAQGIVEDS